MDISFTQIALSSPGYPSFVEFSEGRYLACTRIPGLLSDMAFLTVDVTCTRSVIFGFFGCLGSDASLLRDFETQQWWHTLQLVCSDYNNLSLAFLLTLFVSYFASSLVRIGCIVLLSAWVSGMKILTIWLSESQNSAWISQISVMKWHLGFTTWHFWPSDWHCTYSLLHFSHDCQDLVHSGTLGIWWELGFFRGGRESVGAAAYLIIYSASAKYEVLPYGHFRFGGLRVNHEEDQTNA
jgi:hypothetical protein